MLSVVIPTFNRCKTLQKALAAYQDQSAVGQIAEIIVVDDGSTDATASIVDVTANRSAFPLRYFRQANKGPAAARNLGIREAHGSIILFTDDDIIPTPDLVAQHLEWHVEYPEETTAVLGYVTWAPELHSTPFMEWYGKEVLFAYSEIASHSLVDFRYFYTCNISMRRQFLLQKGTFDEDFKHAACEDIELGFRLQKAGMRLFYNSAALAFHHQVISFDDACNRYKKSAAAAVVLRRKEAGRYSEEYTRTTSSQKQHLKKWLGPVLLPLKSLVDLRIPLPQAAYRTMFRLYR